MATTDVAGAAPLLRTEGAAPLLRADCACASMALRTPPPACPTKAKRGGTALNKPRQMKRLLERWCRSRPGNAFHVNGNISTGVV